MISRCVKGLLLFFDIFGYDSGLSKISRNRMATYCLYFVHVSIAISLTLFKIFVVNWAIFSIGEAISDYLQYLSALFTYWLIIFDSFYYRQAHHRFWKLFQRIDVHIHDQTKLTLAVYSLKFVEFFAITCSLLLIILIINDFYNTEVGLVYALLMKICQIRVFYFLFCLYVIQFQLQVIEKKVDAIKDITIGMNARKDYPMKFN